MSGERQDEWILVRSMDELHKGCAVKIVLCKWCNGGSHFGTVMSAPEEGTGLHADGIVVKETVVMTTIFCGGPPCVGIGVPLIAEGTVYRLRPEETTEASTASRPARLPAEALR